MKAEKIFGRFQHISLPIANQKDKRAKSSQSQSSKQSPAKNQGPQCNNPQGAESYQSAHG